MTTHDDTDKLGTIYTIVRVPQYMPGYIVTTETDEPTAKAARGHLQDRYPNKDFKIRIDAYTRNERDCLRDEA